MVSKHDLVTTNSVRNNYARIRSQERNFRFYVASNQGIRSAAIGIRGVNVHSSRPALIPNTSPLLMGTLNLRGQSDLGS